MTFVDLALERPGTRTPARAPRRSVARTLWWCWLESRPRVQWTVALRFSCAVVLTAGPGALLHARVLLAGLAWSAAYVAVYVVNGVCDLTEDRFNGKDRPMARGDLGPRSAVAVSAGLTVAALAGAWSTGPAALVGVLALLVAGAGYSWRPAQRRARLLRTPLSQPLLILVGGAGTYLVAGWTAGGGIAPAVLVLGACMSAWMACVGALVKDLDDVAGDALAGRRTLAVLRGPEAAARRGGVAALVVGAAALAAGLGLGHLPLTLAGLTTAVAAVRVATACRRFLAGAPGAAGQHPAERARVRTAPYRRFSSGQLAVHVVLLAACAGAGAWS